METGQIPSENPMDHVLNIERMLGELKNHCQKDMDIFEKSDGKALLDTTVEVLSGLERAYQKHAFGYLRNSNNKKGEVVSPKSSEPWD